MVSLTKQLADSTIPMMAAIRCGTQPIVVAFSGGKDSVAMVLYLLEQGIDPSRIHLHHHDVDGRGPKLFDWECTESYCRAFADAFGLSLFVSYRQGGILREIYRLNEPRQDIYYQEVPDGSFLRIDASARAINTRLKFPAVSGNLSIRWCSSTVKIDVLAAAIRRHPAYSRDVVVLTGERREESKVRSGYKAIDRYSAATKKRRAVLWRPLLGWSSADVWAILARWKVQPHPAYMLGWTRCSCQLCIFGSVNIWATLQLMAPHKIEAIARIEQEIGFTLFPGTTIKDYVSRGVALPAQSAYWVQQATGSFTAPVRLDDWRWPPGAFGKESAGAS